MGQCTGRSMYECVRLSLRLCDNLRTLCEKQNTANGKIDEKRKRRREWVLFGALLHWSNTKCLFPSANLKFLLYFITSCFPQAPVKLFFTCSFRFSVRISAAIHQDEILLMLCFCYRDIKSYLTISFLHLVTILSRFTVFRLAKFETKTSEFIGEK